ncbi:hypothetical protein [Metabacillus fastidiosus]|uniref:hypothetical protein n=1 Tax=Metabacillus fastidiosus TaxID=1458 RepID=UPI002DBCDA77|nr:hypothetical protein [Metabacillus fastidiosus]MEC2077032.1 hypothetical protein [Metabacillus fastidiosus]
MCQVKQMNEEIFSNNLLKTVAEIKKHMDLSNSSYKFLIEPVEEKDKYLDGGDEMMKRLVLSPENIGGKKLSLKDTVDVLGGLFPKAPIWINVSFLEIEEEIAIFKLECSSRFRKPTLLKNAETGHAPFKAVL